jgi:CRP/FNR family transcriptional regulator, cyclic AMP receptor protein
MKYFNLFKNDPNFETFPAGTIIFKEGEPGDIMFVIQEGDVEILIKEKVLEIASPGEMIGEMALIDSSSRSATTIAKSDCKLVPISQKRFMFLVQQNPFFALEVMRVLADRLRRINAKV